MGTSSKETAVERQAKPGPEMALPHHTKDLAADSLAAVLLAATEPLCAVLAGHSLSQAMAELAHGIVPQVRAQINELVYGVLRRHGWGDAILQRLIDKPLRQKELRALLLLALYRLDTRPESAHTIVSNAVDAAGILSQGRAGGLANAVLRNFLRRRAELLDDINHDMAVRYQHPPWWLRHLRLAYPRQWRAICIADNALPPLTLRVNHRRTSRGDLLGRLAEANVAAEAVPGFSAAIRLKQTVRIDTLPGYAEGLFAVQDAGAQRAAEWLDLADGQLVLDACAAPGGKSGHILERHAVELLAVDVDAQRCALTATNLARLGHAAQVKVGDACMPEAWWDGRRFDRILADVPCSASGVVRRHPDAKWLRRATDMPALATGQRQIIEALWPLLAPGGKLLYATCSLFPEENSEQIRGFLEAHTDARCIELMENSRFGVQLIPTAIHDGFFYSLLAKAY